MAPWCKDGMTTLLAVFIALASIESFAGNAYPRSPDPRLTPGALCDTPDSYRYPERIPYCERDVSSWQKEIIFIAYRDLGFSLSGARDQYKVDHLIPLCAGGSNGAANLWPQYYTISERTDPLEPLACDVLATGRITQQELVALILEAKRDYNKIPQSMQRLRRLLR
jgi:hypothetical protein